MIDLNTPDWLAKLLRCDSFTQLGRICADPRWRKATADYMRAFLAYTEEKYADRIVAYVLAGGATSEWYDHSELSESSSRTAEWNKQREARGLQPADVPGRLAREHMAFDGLLRDPVVDGEALQYIRFCAGQLHETIAYFLSEARRVVRPEVELGVFHGYPLVLSGGRVVIGNNDCQPLLNHPDLDFIISPTGGFSAIGNDGGDLGPTESVQLHGKKYLRECDQRTHSYNRHLSKYTTFPQGHWKDEKETLAGIKRELAYTIIKRCSCWWFDMWGGFYDAPTVMDLLSDGRKLFDQWLTRQAKLVAQVALIVDPESIYYLNQNDTERTKWFYLDTKNKLARLGAPYECYHFNDIPSIPDRERIRLWILPAVFELTPEKMEILRANLMCDGKTSLFMYAPGISDGKTLDPARVKAVCGTGFATPGVSVAQFGQYRLVYAATGTDLTVAELKKVAKQAGIHLYVEDELPVFADDRLLAVHTAGGGERVVKLPRESREVRELFTNRVVGSDCQTFAYEFQTPDTAFFSY